MRFAVMLAVVLLAGTLVWRSTNRKAVESTVTSPAQTQVSATVLPVTTVTTAVSTNAPPRPGLVPNYSGFQRRPFAVTRAGGNWQWTAEDGMNTNVIRRLAHNDLEYQRLVEENPRIKRRQLVYSSETTAARIERNKLTGEPLERLTLPGLDGQQVDVEILKSDLSPSGQQGAFAGRVIGQPDSLVTLAFKGGREAFTVINPAENLFLHAEPREPGEIIVKSIDPDVYASGYCGNP